MVKAAGVRIAWVDLPMQVRDGVERLLGSRVVGARSQSGLKKSSVGVKLRMGASEPASSTSSEKSTRISPVPKPSRARNAMTARDSPSSGVVLTAVGDELQEIIGGGSLSFAFFSSPEVFDLAELTVTTDVF